MSSCGGICKTVNAVNVSCKIACYKLGYGDKRCDALVALAKLIREGLICIHIRNEDCLLSYGDRQFNRRCLIVCSTGLVFVRNELRCEVCSSCVSYESAFRFIPRPCTVLIVRLEAYRGECISVSCYKTCDNVRCVDRIDNDGDFLIIRCEIVITFCKRYDNYVCLSVAKALDAIIRSNLAMAGNNARNDVTNGVSGFSEVNFKSCGCYSNRSGCLRNAPSDNTVKFFRPLIVRVKCNLRNVAACYISGDYAIVSEGHNFAIEVIERKIMCYSTLVNVCSAYGRNCNGLLIDNEMNWIGACGIPIASFVNLSLYIVGCCLIEIEVIFFNVLSIQGLGIEILDFAEGLILCCLVCNSIFEGPLGLALGILCSEIAKSDSCLFNLIVNRPRLDATIIPLVVRVKSNCYGVVACGSCSVFGSSMSCINNRPLTFYCVNTGVKRRSVIRRIDNAGSADRLATYGITNGYITLKVTATRNGHGVIFACIGLLITCYGVISTQRKNLITKLNLDILSLLLSVINESICESYEGSLKSLRTNNEVIRFRCKGTVLPNVVNYVLCVIKRNKNCVITCVRVDIIGYCISAVSR